MDVITRKNEENLKINQNFGTESREHYSNFLTDLTSFYKGSKIFLTGGTGKNKFVL